MYIWLKIPQAIYIYAHIDIDLYTQIPIETHIHIHITVYFIMNMIFSLAHLAYCYICINM